MAIWNVQLLPTTDPGYLAATERIIEKACRDSLGRGPSGLQCLSEVFESAVRMWIGEQLSLSENRILAYGYTDPRRPRTLYREIDAVSGSDESPTWFFEIKTTCDLTRATSKARRQLGDSTMIGRQRWCGLRRCIICVRLNDNDRYSPSDIRKSSDGGLLVLLNAPFEPDDFQYVVLSGRFVLNMALEYDLVSSTDLKVFAANETKRHRRTIYSLTTASHDALKRDKPIFYTRRILPTGELDPQLAVHATLRPCRNA